jgi:hypothetical protein
MARKAMVPADQEDRVAKVEENELVWMPAGGPGPSNVRAVSKCELNTGYWYCATHQEGFANQLQKDIHIMTNKHRLAWVCFEHGVEVP